MTSPAQPSPAVAVPRILALQCAVPSNAYPQKDVYRDFFASIFRENPKAEEIFLNSRIEKRHSALRVEYFAQERTIEERNRMYVEGSLALGEQTIRACLADTGLDPRQVDAFIVASCTGYSNPGLEILLAKRLGMRENLRRTAIGGMGCYAAFPGMVRAYESLFARPDSLVLLLMVEICSVTLQMDPATENVVASALFGDGAAALILGNGHAPVRPAPPRFPRIIDFETRTAYDTIDEMGFHITSTGFRVQLSARVPFYIRQNVRALTDALLTRNGLDRQDIRHWVVHPGGAKILDYVQEALGLTEDDLRFSRDVLAEYGNMSSPTVMFILDRVIRRADPQPGDYGLMIGFGPGLTIESGLIRW